MLAALIAVTTFGAALLAFTLAEGMLDDRKTRLIESRCRSESPVPAAVSALNGLAAGLLLASTISLMCLLVLLFRYPSARSAVAVPLTTVAVLISMLFMLGAGYETVRPASASAGSHPCGFG
ncbi:hypothetical protein ACWF9G_04525 [Nocardia sp. NPDC055029]|uniref:hypothetical protein n=1 Tax=Nocardia sp. NPDC060259 TaxID=3347088 RepID=UPI00365AC82F